jgi:hypothetical protein
MVVPIRLRPACCRAMSGGAVALIIAGEVDLMPRIKLQPASRRAAASRKA